VVTLDRYSHVFHLNEQLTEALDAPCRAAPVVPPELAPVVLLGS